MTPDLKKLKQEMCDIGQRIWQKGFCAGNDGNHSVRLSGDQVLCTPTGVSKGFLKPEMMTIVDMNGKQVDTGNGYRRTSEILLHLQIYKKRPDIQAVIHSHPPHATAFTCAGIPIPEAIHPEAEFSLGKIRTTTYYLPGCERVGQSVCEVIDEGTTTVLLGNHGTVNFATTLLDAYYKLEILDSYCQLLLNLRQLGQVNLLSRAQMMELLQFKQKCGFPDSRLSSGQIGADNGSYMATFTKPAGGMGATSV